ncbi:MAG: hypothetical protein HP049_05820 [Clostridiales bacterium]|nr:hypothetical protein [Clostridiales bacterium]
MYKTYKERHRALIGAQEERGRSGAACGFLRTVRADAFTSRGVHVSTCLLMLFLLSIIIEKFDFVNRIVKKCAAKSAKKIDFFVWVWYNRGRYGKVGAFAPQNDPSGGKGMKN